ncbi:membrane-bound serine protease (ClpP class) [Salsuginibacillus halophilus]|uniref:Membrane-bound serine protease (ClpP class) n=1 Tax=Salsuginibacillus halophilus TaxID=517424 RepID=A0A2P8HFM1_9BACI|nr:nodulation protein NfeD [Salsuginibacillus halophilus]PSL45027.1 membrane-bound serine protease (ClpP class) [Salsuginibacillus halophilus]
MRASLTQLLSILAVVLGATTLLLSAWSNDGKAEAETSVHFIPVEQAVERGLEAFLDRSMSQAVDDGADLIVLEIDTPGGAVDAANNISDIVRGADVPVTAYVTGEAMSAGAYIALNADHIAMQPGTTMGAAQVVDGSGTAAEDKAQSAWEGNMQGAAERNDRDPQYALAMTNPDLEIEELGVGEGELLTLTAAQAESVGYAEEVVEDRESLLAAYDLDSAEIVEAEVSFAEQLARWVTHPAVIPILLSAGAIGLMIEFFSPGFGLPGLLGLSSLGLFFFGHLFAGFAGYETLILFGIGAVLLAIEIFVPGFGIFGILGLGAIVSSMLMASYSTAYMLVALLIAFGLALITAIVLFKYFGQRGPMKKMVLHEEATAEEGYISNESRTDLVDEIGKTLTPLSPAGSMLLQDERLDVVSEGGYIEQGRNVRVVKASGHRIVVREVEETT